MISAGNKAKLVKCHAFCVIISIYFKTRIHARIEQFVSFVTYFPISKQIFETDFKKKKIS